MTLGGCAQLALALIFVLTSPAIGQQPASPEARLKALGIQLPAHFSNTHRVVRARSANWQSDSFLPGKGHWSVANQQSPAKSAPT